MEKKQVIFFQTNLSPNDEEFYGLIFNNLKNYGVILLDPDGYIISWNKGAELIKGYKQEDVFHNHFSILYTDEDIRADKPHNDLRQSIVNGIHEEESLWIKKDGTKFFVSITIAALINPKGELRGFSMIVKDITKSRTTNEKLININNLLKSVMQERTSELIKLNKTLQEEINRREGVENARILGVEKIESSLKEKEVLLKEIHHRVKNNLQVICSILHLQQDKIDNTEMVQLFLETQHRVRSMALVHDKLYQSPSLATIDFSDYVQSLSTELLRTFWKPGVSISTDITDISFGVDTAIPCGLIVNELITNSLKHGFPDGRAGHVYIGIQDSPPGEYSLTVKDDGVGFPPEFDMHKSTSMGTLVICSLVDQLDGTSETTNQEGALTTIRFHLPPHD